MEGLELLPSFAASWTERRATLFSLLDVALRWFWRVRGPVESFALARLGRCDRVHFLELSKMGQAEEPYWGTIAVERRAEGRLGE